jgi:glycosyltransferase involved in cell wall biosynthesis
MKITFLQSSLWLSGGARVVVEYANRLSQKGHQVAIVIPKGTVSAELGQELDPAVKICAASVPLTKPISLFNQLRLALAMVAAVPKSDLIVTTHTPTTVVSLVAGKILGRGIPVWFYMDYPGMFAERPLEGWLLRHALGWHRAALVLSSHSAQELNSFSQGKTYLVGLGLSNPDLLYPLSADQSERGLGEKRTILYVGDFRPRKGLSDFLAALERVYQVEQNIEVWTVLKEPGEVHTQVPLRQIYRPGAAELAELYRSCSLFVSASWFEGFGLPPLEAMACGAPVVVTDSGGVQDFVRDGDNCLLVPPRSPERMADAMLRVLRDAPLAARLRKNGPPTAANFTWEKATERFEQALLECVRPDQRALE